jgi:sulfide dehydrogenase [flavocytochrome c] flavoprotein chain
MTINLSRRNFGKVLGGAAIASGLSMPALANAKPRVVVIGGGAGGGTVARYLAKDGKGALDVTLIEANPTYTTCFFSNWYLGGFRTFSDITHSYDALRDAYGVNVLQAMATGVDHAKKTVSLAGGGSVAYDALVVAPGIEMQYGAIEGYSQAASQIMPHAWQAGSQTIILKKQLDAMDDGGVFVMSAPPNPFRCPPGPYERVSMIAHYLKQVKPKSKIIVLDPKAKFSKQGLFVEGWNTHYEGMIEHVPSDFGGTVTRVDPKTRTLVSEAETIKADVANVIPAQKAGRIAQLAGLTAKSGWAPIDPASMASTMQKDVWVVGDTTIAGDMPKSGFSANSQAKVAAMTIRGSLLGTKTFPARYRNTCWSLIDTDDAVKVGASYEASPEKIKATAKFISKTEEGVDLRAQTAREAEGWYAGITKDIFG